MVCGFTDLTATIPARPIWGVRKAVGLRKVQLSPMGGTKVPSRGAELGLHSIPHSKPRHPNMLGSASANDKDTAFIMAWKELKEYSPCFMGNWGSGKRIYLPQSG